MLSMVGLLLQPPCLLWSWLLALAWSTRDLLLGQELINFGFSEDQLTPAHRTLWCNCGVVGFIRSRWGTLENF